MPFFFDFKISSASSSYPGAMIPSDTSCWISFAVATSQTSESEIKSPNDDILSAPLALAYAHASGESSPIDSSTQYIFFKTSVSGRPTAAPAGDTCLKDVAAGSPVASFNSFTS